MKAIKLIGKMAIRTGRTKDIGDGSYMSEPIFIIKADDSHIRYKHSGTALRSLGICTLGKDFCDNQWRDFKDLELDWWQKFIIKFI